MFVEYWYPADPEIKKMHVYKINIVCHRIFHKNITTRDVSHGVYSSLIIGNLQKKFAKLMTENIGNVRKTFGKLSEISGKLQKS